VLYLAVVASCFEHAEHPQGSASSSAGIPRISVAELLAVGVESDTLNSVSNAIETRLW